MTLKNCLEQRNKEVVATDNPVFKRHYLHLGTSGAVFFKLNKKLSLYKYCNKVKKITNFKKMKLCISNRSGWNN